jgi:hypothetical protein
LKTLELGYRLLPSPETCDENHTLTHTGDCLALAYEQVTKKQRNIETH